MTIMEGIVCIFYGLFITVAFIVAIFVRAISKSIEREEEIIEVNGVKYKRLDEKKLIKGSYIKISGILFRCYNEEKSLCTTVEELSEEIVQNSDKNKINKKCVKNNRVMFN